MLDMHPKPLTLFVIFVLLTIVLTSCGVQVEVVTPPPPTPTPHLWASLGEDSSNYARTQATPRIVFNTPQSADVQLFMQPQQQVLYIVQYRQVWINATYTVTWFDSPQSNARVRITLYRRDDPDATWESFDSDERELRTETTPSTISDAIGKSVYGETTGRFFVRAEVSVVAFPPDGEIVNAVSTNEFTAVVLNDPGEITTNEDNRDAARVPLGDLAIDKPLWDWRVWEGGPCALSAPSDGDPSHENIDLACESLNKGDMLNARNALTVAAQQAQKPELTAALNSQFGLLAGFTGDFAVAGNAFDAAATAYENTSDAWRLSISLHNMASAQLVLDQEEEAGRTLDRLFELRSQFWDEFGVRLTETNIHYHYKNADQLDGLRWYFNNLGLTDYYNVVDLWLSQLRDEAN
jgi:hypothetical protein